MTYAINPRDYDLEEPSELEHLEDKTSTPAETAAIRIDFAVWLDRLTGRSRRIATTLAVGEGTRDTARKFGLTEGRVSQLRGELKLNWEKFQGEVEDEASELALAGC